MGAHFWPAWFKELKVVQWSVVKFPKTNEISPTSSFSWSLPTVPGCRKVTGAGLRGRTAEKTACFFQWDVRVMVVKRSEFQRRVRVCVG